MDKTSLGDRMKQYETVSKTKLICRTPVIIRLDGKAFHTWTKRIKHTLKNDPFSDDMNTMMMSTSQRLMNNIQNAVLAYTQSDEISILLNDWKKLTTDQWFGNSVQKIASVSASIATVGFNSMATKLGHIENVDDWAMFDARVFNIPKEEVANYFIWRQQDATRNSINMLGQFHFSHRKLQGKNVSQVQDMLMETYGVNWNDCDVWKKRGSCIVPSGWDMDIPIFTKDRNYIEQHLEADEDE